MACKEFLGKTLGPSRLGSAFSVGAILGSNHNEFGYWGFIYDHAVLLASLLVTTADAYTIVMRDGRRIEVPAHFAITQRTLTYEVGPNIQVTLELAAVDIPATEQANSEPVGSLLRKVKQSSSFETKVDNGRYRSAPAKQSGFGNFQASAD